MSTPLLYFQVTVSGLTMGLRVIPCTLLCYDIIMVNKKTNPPTNKIPRQTRSANSSPATKPPKSRKSIPTPLLKLPPVKVDLDSEQETEDSLYASPQLSPTATAPLNSTLLNIIDTSIPAVINKSILLMKQDCPCRLSDKESTYIICAKCSQNWHNKCCNLVGTTPQVIKKMEVWECPRCYRCPLAPQEVLKPEPDITQFQRFIDSTEEVKKCTDNLNESVSKVNDLNDHLMHLLLDDKKLRLHQDAMRDLSSLIQKAPEKYHTDHQAKVFESIDSMKEDIQTLKQHISEIKIPTPKLPAEDDKVLTAINQIDNKLKAVMVEDELLKTSIKEFLTDDKHKYYGPKSPPAASSMIPNTKSPHFTKECATPVCAPYTSYAPNILSEDIKQELANLISANAPEFQSEGGSRETIYYGEFGYTYSGKKHEAKPIPPAIERLTELVRPLLSDPNQPINSCLISRYCTGSDFIPPHRDDEIFINPSSDIVTVSMGAARIMQFKPDNTDTKTDLVMEDGSVLISSRFSQDFWTHGILKDENISEERISFTLRHIAPFYMNSTVLVGDSNTKHLKFGTELGKSFGKWLPGKRIEAFRIEQIPSPTELGPYRNIIINTGINNIKPNYNMRSHRALVDELESKCMDIHNTYPNARIHISLLLPTKSQVLNNRVKTFNDLISDMTYRHSFIHTIDNMNLCGSNGCLSDDYGCYDKVNKCPLKSDILHLGQNGIKQFVHNLKSVIKNSNITKGSPSNRRKFKGNYRDAARSRKLESEKFVLDTANRFGSLAGGSDLTAAAAAAGGPPSVHHDGYQST